MILDDFLRLVWNSAELRADIEGRARTSAGIYKINQTNLAEVKVPVPSLQGQQRITVRLSEQIAHAERTTQVVEAQLAAINVLPAALLRRAFSGEL
jgi:type I restriction enzyme S subunit